MIKKYLSLFLICLFFYFVLSLINSSGQEKVYKATIDTDGVQRIEIIADSYYFDPNHIIVKINTPVEFKVKKTGIIVPHNIVMAEPDAGITFREDLSRESKIIKFTPKKGGKFKFYCDKKLLFFESHREKGMEAILEVVE